jgi:hypothetical protein
MDSSYPDQTTIHESSADRQRQAAILQRFCNHFKVAAKMTATVVEYDAELYDPADKTKPIGLAEVKFRNNSALKYPDYQIDVNKVHSLLLAAKRGALRASLIVSWQGDVRYLSLTQTATAWDGQSELFPVTVTQRGDRNELADRQYHIPMSMFQKI